VGFAADLGCEAFQLFVSNPRAWAPPSVSADAAREFRARLIESGLGPAYVHASYLVNIASPDPQFLRRSIDLARRELESAEAIGADGLVVHAGAGGAGERGAAVQRAVRAIQAIAGSTGGPPEVLLELTAGGTGTVASTLSEAAELLTAVGTGHCVALCLDTCHLFAAGYGLDTSEGVAGAMDELRSLRLTRRLRLVHANDSRFPRGSRRDRHQHVGQGLIGEAGIRRVLNDPAVRRGSVLVETPGTLEDHRRNVAALRRLASV
jgi:deoxyribonuclease-4